MKYKLKTAEVIEAEPITEPWNPPAWWAEFEKTSGCGYVDLSKRNSSGVIFYIPDRGALVGNVGDFLVLCNGRLSIKTREEVEEYYEPA